ncbi:hypothetical protein DTO027B5_1259 [Paecilomyces variotii]|nr:hypothetical protein DTO169C6_7386 [Paecilomyces variotii]KAJ9324121.1 hypothetical protein DTO027B3_4937 [Paecilomyces variotii]KAJ9337085.1 hypothetical protein DTO027B5_1259 [Paecilomyces variotii]KAJ9396537.1 hypothetical protein DTO282F9_6508 [Paecilomyces variotii]KAJ9403558.1 hypothetical protein DTO045G8_8695 [Paecilomyces variotii]
MSNYPPTPSFGGAFSYTQQWPPPQFSTPPLSALPSYPFSGSTDIPGQPPVQTGPVVGNPSDLRNMTNLDGNTRIPGLGAHGSLPPPPPSFPYMNQFQSPNIPPPTFHTLPVPPMGLPSLPRTTAHINPLASASQAPALSRANPAVDARENAGRVTPNGLDTIDREEGELSDGDGRVSSQSQRSVAQPFSGSSQGFLGAPEQIPDGRMTKSVPSSSFATSRDSRQQNPSSDSSERMDYEPTNVPSPTDRSPRREESGSPYHPPVSISLDPTAQEFMPITTITQTTASSDEASNKLSPTKDANGQSLHSSKSPAQLRVLAQGALLSLAPHNIRYNELVSEGIDSTVLKRLYEEVGIKVPTVSGEQKPVKDTSKPSRPDVVPVQPGARSDSTRAEVVLSDAQNPTKLSEKKPAENLPSSGPVGVSAEGQKITAKDTNVPPSGIIASQTESKPLERKEVIARMLAAKAGKLTTLAGTSKPPSEKDTSVSSAAVSKPLETTVQTAPPSETQVKEKNKAQTELARQRMEQLKKQGILRSQRSHVDGESSIITQQHHGAVGAQSQPSQDASTVSKIQHPLPNRPPEPETSVPARIPGLFMTSSEQSAPGELSSTPKTNVGATMPQVGNSQRKRPRASDFDGLGTPPKKVLTTESVMACPEDRLVIDISDDEDLYGENDENGATATNRSQHRTVSEAPAGLPSSTEYPLKKPGAQPHQRAAASSTPQTPLKIGDQEELRLRDQQIQEMRKKIAALEERKRAKLAASRVQSPPDSNRAASASLDTPLVSKPSMHASTSSAVKERHDQPTVQANFISSVGSQGSGSPALIRSPSVQSLTSVDPAHLERMRAKFMRKKEIESGLPALDAELSKSEAKLAEFKREEERLRAEIAKGREGKRQLMEELESLGVETQGLSMEELQAAKAAFERPVCSTVALSSASIENTPSAATSNVQNVDETAPKDASPDHEPSLRTDVASRTDIAHAPVSVPQTSQEAIELTMSATVEDSPKDADGESEELSDGASSSSGSAMDESVDSPRPMSIGQSEPDEDSSNPHIMPPDLPEAPRGLEPVEAETDAQPCPRVSPQRPPTPQEHEILNEVDQEKTASNIEEVHTSREPSVMSDDVYEPPEPEPEPNPDIANTVYTPPFSPPPPGSIEPEDTVAAPSPHPQPEAGEELMQDVQKPKPLDESHIETLQGDRGSQELEHHFVPYISPLRYFTAYRYHPNFTEDVSDGFRSLTYSHNIDPTKFFCPYETAGGVCNDHSCEYQHFRDISLSDDKILVQMGSQREGRTPEEKDNYIAGLKQIINDMRRDKVKDFNTVAAEIAAYRRRFLQDPSRILPL